MHRYHPDLSTLIRTDSNQKCVIARTPFGVIIWEDDDTQAAGGRSVIHDVVKDGDPDIGRPGHLHTR